MVRNMNDRVLISTDDHICEPPTLLNEHARTIAERETAA